MEQHAVDLFALFCEDAGGGADPRATDAAASGDESDDPTGTSPFPPGTLESWLWLHAHPSDAPAPAVAPATSAIPPLVLAAPKAAAPGPATADDDGQGDPALGEGLLPDAGAPLDTGAPALDLLAGAPPPPPDNAGETPDQDEVEPWPAPPIDLVDRFLEAEPTVSDEKPQADPGHADPATASRSGDRDADDAGPGASADGTAADAAVIATLLPVAPPASAPADAAEADASGSGDAAPIAAPRPAGETTEPPHAALTPPQDRSAANAATEASEAQLARAAAAALTAKDTKNAPADPGAVNPQEPIAASVAPATVAPAVSASVTAGSRTKTTDARRATADAAAVTPNMAASGRALPDTPPSPPAESPAARLAIETPHPLPESMPASAPQNETPLTPLAAEIAAMVSAAVGGRESGGAGQPSSDDRERQPRAHAGEPVSAAASRLAQTVQLMAGFDRALEGAAPQRGSASSEPLPNEPQVTQTIVKSMRLQYQAGGGTAVVKLDPEFLGGVTVSLQLSRGAVTASLQAERPEVRAWLEANESTLRRALGEQGLTLDRLVVTGERPIVHETSPDGRRRAPQPPPDARAPRRSRSSDPVTFEVVV